MLTKLIQIPGCPMGRFSMVYDPDRKMVIMPGRVISQEGEIYNWRVGNCSWVGASDVGDLMFAETCELRGMRRNQLTPESYKL